MVASIGKIASPAQGVSYCQSACTIDPLSGTAEVVPVVNRGDPSGLV